MFRVVRLLTRRGTQAPAEPDARADHASFEASDSEFVTLLPGNRVVDAGDLDPAGPDPRDGSTPGGDHPDVFSAESATSDSAAAEPAGSGVAAGSGYAEEDAVSDDAAPDDERSDTATAEQEQEQEQDSVFPDEALPDEALPEEPTDQGVDPTAPGTAQVAAGEAEAEVGDLDADLAGDAAHSARATGSADETAPEPSLASEGQIGGFDAASGGGIVVTSASVTSADGPGAPAGPSDAAPDTVPLLRTNPDDAAPGPPDAVPDESGTPSPLPDHVSATENPGGDSHPEGQRPVGRRRRRTRSRKRGDQGAAVAGVAAGKLSDAEVDRHLADSEGAASGGGTDQGGHGGGMDSPAGGSAAPGDSPVQMSGTAGSFSSSGSSGSADGADYSDAGPPGAGGIVFFDDFGSWAAGGDDGHLDPVVQASQLDDGGAVSDSSASSARGAAPDSASGFAGRHRGRRMASIATRSDAKLIKIVVVLAAAGLLAALLLTLDSNEGASDRVDPAAAAQRVPVSASEAPPTPATSRTMPSATVVAPSAPVDPSQLGGVAGDGAGVGSGSGTGSGAAVPALPPVPSQPPTSAAPALPPVVAPDEEGDNDESDESLGQDPARKDHDNNGRWGQHRDRRHDRDSNRRWRWWSADWYGGRA